VPNGTGAKMSAWPPRASGHGACFDLAGPGDHILAGGLYRRRQGGRGDDRLACGPTGTGQHGERGRGHHQPHPHRGERHETDRAHQGGGAGGQDEAPRGADVPPSLVDPQVVRQQPIRRGLPLKARQVRHMPPSQQRGHGAPDADQRPPGGHEQITGCADAVVGGGVPVPGGGELHMLPGRLPGAPVGGDDGLALGPAVRQVGICGARGLDGPGFGARVLGAERDNLGVWVVIDPIG
jgi:hypothetical protein